MNATAYADGSCLGNPGPGGWGVHVQFEDGQVVDLGGGEQRTTNNRMELRAAIEAVRATRECQTVTVIVDSEYVKRGITGWVAGWKKNGWRTRTG
ncbi:MAG TPA: ribonuclease H, partial [Chloroflexota bacterium]|nr:ribonuclease H [Chloroflexota bacterium]